MKINGKHCCSGVTELQSYHQRLLFDREPECESLVAQANWGPGSVGLDQEKNKCVFRVGGGHVTRFC